jgi:hypothetical protein
MIGHLAKERHTPVNVVHRLCLVLGRVRNDTGRALNGGSVLKARGYVAVVDRRDENIFVRLSIGHVLNTEKLRSKANGETLTTLSVIPPLMQISRVSC